MLRSIKTAPRDGTFVLLFGGQTDELAGLDGEPIDRSRPVVARWTPREYEEEGGFWTFAYWDSDWRSEYVSPTHWMPLSEVTKS